MRSILPLLLCALLCTVSIPTHPIHAYPVTADGPTLLKRTIDIKLRRFLRYWKNPAAAEPQYNTYCWVPQISFEAFGPVPGGSQFVAEFNLPDGKPWLSINLPTNEIGADDSDHIKMSVDDDMEKKAIILTGVFPFKILLKNPLSGTNDTLFAGTYKVSTYAPDQNIPEYKGKKEFFIEQDWRLPIGYIWLYGKDDENVPPLNIGMWFRGNPSRGKIEALLFYKGKQIAACTNSYPDAENETAVGDDAHKWTHWPFYFPTVRGFNKDTSANSYDSMFFLDKNPGEYEVKVLRDSKLARTAKFTVGADGKIVDNGIARANKMGGIRMVLPVTILGNGDYDYNAQGWKADAFYGNPLSGFTAPDGSTATTEKNEAAVSTVTGGTQTVAGGPPILKYSLHVRARRMVRYWKFPEQDNYWSWIPEVSFQVLGPVANGAQFQVDYTLPDGKPWFTAECDTTAIAEGGLGTITTPQQTGHMDKRAILDTGTFGFRIRLKNEISGMNQELFKGKFTVKKFHVGNDLPQFKNQFEYYVDQDWMLPVGYLWLDYFTEKNAPPLKATMWFHNENDATKLAAYLFYNGKQIATTKTSSTGVANSDKSLLTAGNDTSPRWERWTFTWFNVRGYILENAVTLTNGHVLYSNPGDYEIKVINDGELVRTASFSVGKDGKIVDNGIATQNKIGGFSFILPVKVLGTKDGQWDANAWKDHAFYDNPLAGFTAP
ncbi:MAG: hypothetical protein K1Y36_23550 [Blastocatellia bacterium]|nr:hypothetical protein [Blastocatellia bacterium]